MPPTPTATSPHTPHTHSRTARRPQAVVRHSSTRPAEIRDRPSSPHRTPHTHPHNPTLPRIRLPPIHMRHVSSPRTLQRPPASPPSTSTHAPARSVPLTRPPRPPRRTRSTPPQSPASRPAPRPTPILHSPYLRECPCPAPRQPHRHPDHKPTHTPALSPSQFHSYAHNHPHPDTHPACLHPHVHNAAAAHADHAR